MFDFEQGLEIQQAQRVMMSLFTYATVLEVDGSRVKVTTEHGIETEFLPVLTTNASETKAFCPIAVGEQVLVCAVGGDLNSGVVMGSIFKTSDEESVKEFEYAKQFKDGVKITKKEKTLTIQGEGLKLNIVGSDVSIAAGNVNLDSKGSVSIAGKGDVLVNGSRVEIGKTCEIGAVGATSGVVTGECLCAFTGAPHPITSSVLKVGLTSKVEPEGVEDAS